jgi:PHD/YefM family antitoxin component YafN of YafNO toxin-antitoxin module
MTTITLGNLQSNLNSLISKTLADDDALTITTEEGAVVLVSEKEWNALQETILLLKDEKSFRALLDGHKSRNAGYQINAESTETAFYDLQN